MIYKWLNIALDCGITEKDFWEMTFAEVNRAIASRNRVKRAEMQEKASYDYILAQLIGKSMAKLYSSTVKFPSIGEAYPTLFDSEEMQQQKQEQKDNLSALRFKQFAHSYNKRFNGGVKN